MDGITFLRKIMSERLAGGFPKETIRLEAAGRIEPLDNIARLILAA